MKEITIITNIALGLELVSGKKLKRLDINLNSIADSYYGYAYFEMSEVYRIFENGTIDKIEE